MFNQQSKPPGLWSAMSGENELENELNEKEIEPNNELDPGSTSDRNVRPNGELESNADPKTARSINELESSNESPKELSTKSSTKSSAKSETVDRKSERTPKCEEYHHDCAGCLSQENCVFCWYEKQCVRQRRFDAADYVAANGGGKKRPNSDPRHNHRHSTPRGLLSETGELNALSEAEAARLNNNTILIRPLGIVPKNTCPQRNTLSNISASSCAVNEMTLLWLMFSSVILSVIVLFGCLFYCCVFRSKPTDMIIIASDKDNFVLIDEE